MRLLEQIEAEMEHRHLAKNTRRTYLCWIDRFIRFHWSKSTGWRHPKDMGAKEVVAFLNYQTRTMRISASTWRQACSALIFLYEKFYGREREMFDGIEKPKRHPSVPRSISHADAIAVINNIPDGRYRLIAQIMYGSGLRIGEVLVLRVKDIDFDQNTITVHEGKGGKNRTTLLPRSIRPALKEHMDLTRRLHVRELQEGFGSVEMPHALERKMPTAHKQWIWQYVFPADHRSKCPKTGIIRRHHIFASTVQKVVRDAARRAEVTKRVTPHVFRHSFATRLVEAREPLPRVQALMGHADIKQTMRYVLAVAAGQDTVSPLDDPLHNQPVKRFCSDVAQDVDGNGFPIPHSVAVGDKKQTV